MKKLRQSLETTPNVDMKQVNNLQPLQKLIFLSIVFFSILCTPLQAQEADPAKGKSLFNANCAACHQLDKKMTGPALRYVETRLSEDEGLDRDWLNAWIRNSAAVIKSGDAYANKIYNEYNGAAMTAFPQLSDEDISNILAYTRKINSSFH
jgi:mono/diheme cytochrome c family protein